MKNNTFFWLLISFLLLNIIALFVIMDYQQQKIDEAKFNEMWNDMVKPCIDTHLIDINTMSDANVTVGDSIAFEYAASLVKYIDTPEEPASTGDTLCAYIQNDTMFIQHYHNTADQQYMFRYRHNY